MNGFSFLQRKFRKKNKEKNSFGRKYVERKEKKWRDLRVVGSRRVM